MGKAIFFLTTGRTGTKKLASYLKEFCPPQIAVDHQTPGARIINILANMHYHGFSTRAMINRRVQRAIAKNRGKDCYINCDPLLSFGLSCVDFTGLDASFVHVERKANDFARSMINWQFTKMKSFVAHNFLPFWQPDIWPLEHILHLFSKAYLKQKYCNVWKVKNKVFEREFQGKHPYLRIEFEELFDLEKGDQTFRRLADFMEIEIQFHTDIFFDRENASVSRFLE